MAACKRSIIGAVTTENLKEVTCRSCRNTTTFRSKKAEEDSVRGAEIRNRLAELIYADLTELDWVGEFLDSLDEHTTSKVIDTITETLSVYAGQVTTGG